MTAPTAEDITARRAAKAKAMVQTLGRARNGGSWRVVGERLAVWDDAMWRHLSVAAGRVDRNPSQATRDLVLEAVAVFAEAERRESERGTDD